MKHYASIIVFVALTVSSAVSSIGSYQATKDMIVDDLNRALALTIAEEQAGWLTPDTIRTCRRLQETTGGSVALSAGDDSLRRHITIPRLRDMAYVRLDVPADGGTTARSLSAAASTTDGLLCSDTVVWRDEGLGENVALRSYARCSAATVFGMSDQRLPLVLWLSALLWMAAATLWHRRKAAGLAEAGDEVSVAVKGGLSYGGITLSPDGNSFSDTEGRTLRLTPMQHRLMLMFFRSPSHCLPKQEICDALWPRKEDANDTLYTLVRRLKPVIETAGRLRIEADRGRAYRLTVRPSD